MTSTATCGCRGCPAWPQSSVPVAITDSTWIVAGACGALGLVLFAFGAVAWHVTNAERQAAQPPSS